MSGTVSELRYEAHDHSNALKTNLNTNIFAEPNCNHETCCEDRVKFKTVMKLSK